MFDEAGRGRCPSPRLVSVRAGSATEQACFHLDGEGDEKGRYPPAASRSYVRDRVGGIGGIHIDRDRGADWPLVQPGLGAFPATEAFAAQGQVAAAMDAALHFIFIAEFRLPEAGGVIVALGASAGVLRDIVADKSIRSPRSSRPPPHGDV